MSSVKGCTDRFLSLASRIQLRHGEDMRLFNLICESYVASRGVYVSPRVFADLRIVGERLCKHQVDPIFLKNTICKQLQKPQ